MQSSLDKLPPTYLAFIVVVLCAGVLSLISILNSLFSGWHKLSKRFSASSEPCGEIKTAGPFGYTVYMRYWGQYSGMIRMAAANDALYLSVILPFRLGHPPLRIPWDETQMGETRRFWRNYIVLTLGNNELIPMRISERMARNLGILEKFPIESTSAR